MKATHFLLILLCSYSTVSLAEWTVVERNATNSGISSVKEHKSFATGNITSHLQSNNPIIISTGKSSYGSHENIDFTYDFVNQSNSDMVEFELLLPEKSQFIADDTFITLPLAQETTDDQLTIAGNKINWQGTLTKPKLSFTPFDNNYFGYIPLSETFNTKPQACAVNCENDIWWSDFNFIFQGINISRFYISKQGEVFFDQDRDNEAPYAVISPLFTSDNAFTNEVRFAEIINSTNESEANKVYLVIEWTHRNSQCSMEKCNDVESIEQRYQLIIEEFSQNIWFNYLDINTLDDATIAKAQNETSMVNFDILTTTAKYLIAEKAPQNNASFLMLNEPGSKLQLNSSIQVNELSTITIERNHLTQEDETLTIEVPLNNLKGAMELQHKNSSTNEYLTTSIPVYLNSNDLAIKQQSAPNMGDIHINNNDVIYTPSPDANGTDIFTINIQDSYAQSDVTFSATIVAVNDAPTINLNNDIMIIKENTTVTISAEVEDIDSDELVISWQQLSGETINYAHKGNTLTLSIPRHTNSSEMVFTITVSDGEIEVSKNVTFVIENKPSGGSLVYLLFLIISGMVGRNRTHENN